MKILLVNDDGPNSPALIPTIEILENLGDLTTIIPAKNQSSTAKCFTRRSEGMAIKQIMIDDREISTLEGFPADCANYGIFNQDKAPDLLVSGMNIGHNVGLHAFLSSGTIGAAMEGLIARIPSIALSSPYEPGESLTEEKFRITAQQLEPVIKKFNEKGMDQMAMMSINAPLGKENFDILGVDLDKLCFGPMFEKQDENFVKPIEYSKIPPIKDRPKGTDSWAKENKICSVIGIQSNLSIISASAVQKWLSE